jgi:hypothetical protein
MHDPILMRNCQAEYDHAAAGFGAAAPQDLYTPAAIDTRNAAFLRRIECKIDQENHKLDYLLNINGARR